MKHWNSIDGRDMEVEISYVIEKKKIRHTPFMWLVRLCVPFLKKLYQ